MRIVGSGERQNLTLSRGVKARVGDNEVERLKSGDRPGPWREGKWGSGPPQGDSLGDSRGGAGEDRENSGAIKGGGGFLG